MWLLEQKPLRIEVRLVRCHCAKYCWYMSTGHKEQLAELVGCGRTGSVWSPVKGWRCSQTAGQREMLKCICLPLVVIDENGLIMTST